MADERKPRPQRPVVPPPMIGGKVYTTGAASPAVPSKAAPPAAPPSESSPASPPPAASGKPARPVVPPPAPGVGGGARPARPVVPPPAKPAAAAAPARPAPVAGGAKPAPGGVTASAPAGGQAPVNVAALRAQILSILEEKKILEEPVTIGVDSKEIVFTGRIVRIVPDEGFAVLEHPDGRRRGLWYILGGTLKTNDGREYKLPMDGLAR